MSLQSFLNQPVAREGSKPETYDRVESFFPSAAQLRDFEGTYYSEELEVRYSIAVDGDQLKLRGRNLPREPFQPTFRDAFTVRGMSFEFSRDKAGKITAFAVQAGRIRNVKFVRQSELP